MTAKDKQLKSAVDLALERLAARAGTSPAVTAEQKHALAEVAQKTKASIAELEILHQQRLAKTRAGTDPAKVAEALAKLEAEHSVAVRKLRDEEERQQDRIRQKG